MNIFKSNKSEKEISLSLEEDDDAKDFMEYLKEAQETDLREIERTGCVSQGRDMRNGNVIVMIPSLGLNRMERPEQMFRKMLLLFLLKTHEMVGTAYSVVYAHTAIDIINQYPLIYKFYSILPRFYKKNLQKMYIIHPNIGIRAFFEFARIFLSHKFYNKLCLLESILDFQRVIFPTQLPLPLKFLRKEDEEREVKYIGPMPSVQQSYINSLGTMEVLWICAEFLRENNLFRSPGIFRVPGDEGEVSLAKIRLQYGYNAEDPQNGWISLSENKKYIIIGNINDLYIDNSNIGNNSSSSSSSSSGSSSANAEDNSRQIQPPHSSGTASGSVSAHASLNRKHSTGSIAGTAGFEGVIPTCSLVILNNAFTVAELFKLSIRELASPLVPEDLTQDLLTLTRVYGSRPLDHVWEKACAQRLADLPLSNLSTLIFIVRFLREVGAESAHNSMDTRNLSLVFAPTIFRFAMTDLIAATIDIKLIQIVMREIIERPTLLQHTVRFFKSMYAQKRTFDGRTGSSSPKSSSEDAFDVNEMEQLLRMNPFLSSLDMELSIPVEEFTSGRNLPSGHQGGENLAEMISSGLSPAMVARMTRAATARRPNPTHLDLEDDSAEKNEDDEDVSDRISPFSTTSISPARAEIDGRPGSSSNRKFALGRGIRSGDGMSGNFMYDRDLDGCSDPTEAALQRRGIPPTPPPRQLPVLKQPNVTPAEVETREAISLNGQIDREALRLLNDLQLTDQKIDR